MNKFLLISQGRSGSTKTFHYIADELKCQERIKEFQQLTKEDFEKKTWTTVPAMCVLTDPAFMNNKRKRNMVFSLIDYCGKNDFTFVSVFRDNLIKRNISRQYAYLKNNWSFSNKNNIDSWRLDIDDLERRVNEEEKLLCDLNSLIRDNVREENRLLFEDLFERPGESYLSFNDGREMKLDFYRASYLEVQEEMYRNIVNLNEIPLYLLKKYPLFQ